MRTLAGVVVAALLAAGCADDRVALRRGPLGPATYSVTLEVHGDVALVAETVDADLEVAPTASGAQLVLAIEGDDPVLAELERAPDGRLRLETVQGVAPPSAGETDLATLVGQLDPPLPEGPVRIGDTWSSVRRIATDVVEASLRTRLRLVRFHRVGGADAAVLEGTVTGRLRTSGPTGTFDGELSGDTEISWVVDPGRVGASQTVLRWRVGPTDVVEIRTSVRPS